MTLYVLIGLAWIMVLLASLTLRVLREREPEPRWRLLLLAAAAPFLLYPVTTVCRALLGQVAARIPLLDTPWPLVALAGIGAVVALGRVAAIVRRQRALLAACTPPEPETAARVEAPLRCLSRAAGLRRVPRVLLYPRGAYVCTLGVRRPTIVLSRGLLTSLGDEEVEAAYSGHPEQPVRRIVNTPPGGSRSRGPAIVNAHRSGATPVIVAVSSPPSRPVGGVGSLRLLPGGTG